MRVANARMYSVNAATTEAWRSLLSWVVAQAGVDGEVIDYPPPQPLPALWARDDLGCAFMCGYPLSQAMRAHTVLAAPIPSPPTYGGQAVYWTNLVARRDGPVQALSDAFGRRMAYTTPESQSGYQAPRVLFAAHAREHGSPLFAAMVGPLITPRRVVEAVLAGDADIGPVDSYAFDLMRRHEPAWLEPLAVIAATVPMPIPPLVGAPAVAKTDASRLRRALLSVADAPELGATREALLLRGFAAVSHSTYAVLQDAARSADALGYPRLI
jgi:ABC-type phosphate/phosphonate transport system substrate-binding protein